MRILYGVCEYYTLRKNVSVKVQVGMDLNKAEMKERKKTTLHLQRYIAVVG